ncbi:type I restriction enzyme endonuclease domain-containing protein [Streptomyces sp. NPDC000880]
MVPGYRARQVSHELERPAVQLLLARHNYPPDQEVEAINLVLKQMEHFANEWSQDGTAAG